MKVESMIPVNLNRPSLNRRKTRVMEDFLRDTCATGRCIKTDTFQVDIIDEGEGYLILADLPGATKEQIELDGEGNHMTIHVERPRSDDSLNYLHNERRKANMSRSLVLGDSDMEQAQASLTDGVLSIRVPKRQVNTE